MKDTAHDWFEPCVTELTRSGSQRVWSVLVTIFGDLAPDRTDQISGGLITALTGLVGIRAEATRVALHRLRKDGWIDSTRVGRTSVHRLTEFGRAQSAEAAPRIYARTQDTPGTWHILIASSGEASRKELSDLMLTGDYITLNTATAMAPGPVPDGLEELLGVESDQLTAPHWLRDLCAPEHLRHAYSDLLAALNVVEQALPAQGVPDPMQAAMLRVLIVHGWRRIVLRHPALPSELLPADWSGPECRETVSRLLDRLPKPDLETLERGLSG